MDALGVNAVSHTLAVRHSAGDNAQMNKREFKTPLAEMIHAAGTSDNKVAKALGMRQSTLSRIANGTSKDPNRVNLLALAHYFGVSPDELLEFRDKASRKTAPQAQEQLPAIAYDIAKRWLLLSPERQEWIRDLIFTTAYMEEKFPAIRKGRPKGETYSAFERAVEKDMRQLSMKFDP